MQHKQVSVMPSVDACDAADQCMGICRLQKHHDIKQTVMHTAVDIQLTLYVGDL